MALKYDPSKIPHATEVTQESITEQEHKDSCDINKMLKSAQRGLQVRGGPPPVFGPDDTTMTGLQFRQEKARLEHELAESAKAQEYLEGELNHIPPDIRKKFGFKQKKDQPQTAQTNDDLTTKKSADLDPANTKQASKT